MRGYAHYNFPAFDAAQKYLEDLGYNVISPANIDRVMEGWGKVPPEGHEVSDEDRRRIIARDIQELLTFRVENGDVIFFLEGWEKSAGVKLERALGEFLGLEFIYQPGHVLPQCVPEEEEELHPYFPQMKPKGKDKSTCTEPCPACAEHPATSDRLRRAGWLPHLVTSL
jgi:hypothetical protein